MECAQVSGKDKSDINEDNGKLLHVVAVLLQSVALVFLEATDLLLDLIDLVTELINKTKKMVTSSECLSLLHHGKTTLNMPRVNTFQLHCISDELLRVSLDYLGEEIDAI